LPVRRSAFRRELNFQRRFLSSAFSFRSFKGRSREATARRFDVGGVDFLLINISEFGEKKKGRVEILSTRSPRRPLKVERRAQQEDLGKTRKRKRRSARFYQTLFKFHYV
jgi:hypothetical protein